MNFLKDWFILILYVDIVLVWIFMNYRDDLEIIYEYYIKLDNVVRKVYIEEGVN